MTTVRSPLGRSPTGETQKLVLLDAHAIIHRAYHALPDLTANGEPTGGLYGLASMLLRLASELKPDYLVAAYDRPEATFRKQVYEQYKGTRPKADEALVSQLIRSREVFAAFNIPIYDQAGFEADDIIGTIVEQVEHPKVSPLDSDAQGETLGPQIIIASGDLDTLQLVEGGRVTVYTFKKGLNDTITYDEPAVFKRFNFAPTLLPDFKGLAGDQSDNIIGVKGIGEKTASLLINQFGPLEKIYQLVKKQPAKLRTAGLRERQINLLREGEEEAFFSKTLATIRRDAPIKFQLPMELWRAGINRVSVEDLFNRLQFRSLLSRLRTVLENGEERVLVAAEPPTVPVDQTKVRELGIALWLLNSELTAPDADDILHYTGVADLAAAEPVLLQELTEKNLERVYREIELPLIPILTAAEQRGVLVDAAQLKKLSGEYHRELNQLETKIYKLTGGEFNLNSPKQLAEVLFDKLHLSLKGLKKTPGGVSSTRESELLKLKDKHPAIAAILTYRELQKLLTTYIDNIPPLLDRTSRLHTTFNQTGTTTGRLSSRDPNLQNIPATGRGLDIRRAFMASAGFSWAAFDYSQIEMRVLARLSGDEELLGVFARGEDIHSAVAAKVFNVMPAAITPEMRRRAKVINFGIIYGMGVNALRANLNSTRDEAQQFYDQYFAAFPKISAYFDAVKTRAAKLGYTETLFGRRRYFPGLKSPVSYVRAGAERMAMNAPLQGTAADLVKLAMIKVDQLITQNRWREKVFLLLQVHDELVYEVAEELTAEAVPQIKQAMEAVAPDGVAFTVHAGAAANWAEVKK